jgi:DHA2 family multidrug resistance protein-like MFS transporter
MSVNGALIRFIYPHRLLGRGIGINALLVAFASAVGPTLAAGILSAGSWPWLFAVNIPFGVAAYAVGLTALPHTPRGSHAFDWPSAGLSAVMFGLGIAAIDSVGHGAPPARYLGEAVFAVLAGVLLVRRQGGVGSPLLPVDLLRIPVFTLSICASVASFCAQMLALVALPFYLQDRFGYSAVEIGLLLTPWPVALGFTAPLAGRLVEHFPAGLLGGIGMAMFAAGLFALAMLPVHPATLDVVWRMALGGAGFGLFQAPNNRTMLSAAPRERSGGASGMLGTARLLGQTVGAALVALLFARLPVEGARAALFVGIGFSLAGAALSALRLSNAGRRGAIGRV